MEPTPELKVYKTGILIGLSIGGIMCLGGMILTVLGFAGSIDWIVEGAGFTSKLKNAAPGIFFALLGFFLVWRYKPQMKSYKDSTKGVELIEHHLEAETNLSDLAGLLRIDPMKKDSKEKENGD